MNIFEDILSALEREDSVMLATIISAAGSTPAAVHSKMLVFEGGAKSAGTIGGGCMEGDVILQAKRLYNARRWEIMTFELNEDDVEGGLICGGNLEVLIEPVTRNEIPLLRKLQSLSEDGFDSLLATLLSPDGSIAWKQILHPGDDSAIKPVPGGDELMGVIGSALEKAGKKQETQILLLPSGTLIIEPAQGMPDLVIFGGGHVSKFLASSAAMVGFRVTVADDREKYANPARFSGSAKTVVVDFADPFAGIAVKPTTYIVIVTRGHRYDEIVLEQAVGTQAKYIGMIGSRKKIFATYEHLAARGVSGEKLKRVFAPVGIDVAAATAEEIAVSITAELISVRRGAVGKPARHMKEDNNF